jgi:beta-lactamase regulating signal transducer with metallopeptidase domain
MILPLHLQAIAEASVTGILISIAGGVPIALFVWAGLGMRRQSSGTRFAVWYATLLIISLLPLVQHMQSGAVLSASDVPSHALISISSSWAVGILAVWGVFATIGLFRVAVGVMRLRNLRRNCTRVDAAGLDLILQNTLRELHSTRGLQISVSEELRVPAAIGFFNPLVILPSWVLQDLPASQLSLVLLHELAHVSRWDDWTNLLQKVIQAILFFHPAVWWIEKKISLEREMACDDVVLAHTENPRAYAESLLSVAERSFVRRGVSLAQAAVNRMRETSTRISQILSSKRSGKSGSWKPASMVLAASSILSFMVLPHVGSLVSFQNNSSVRSAAKLVVPLKSKENLIQVAGVNAPLPARFVHTVSLKTKRTFVAARQESHDVLNGSVIQASFPTDAGYADDSEGKSTAIHRQALVTQTVFAVARFQQDGQPSQVWTVRIWQLTVVERNLATPDTIPAKKV